MKEKRTINIITRPRPDNEHSNLTHYKILEIVESQLSFRQESPDHRWFQRNPIRVPSRHPYARQIAQEVVNSTFVYRRSVLFDNSIEYEINIYFFKRTIPDVVEFYALIGLEILPQAYIDIVTLRDIFFLRGGEPDDFFLLPVARRSINLSRAEGKEFSTDEYLREAVTAGSIEPHETIRFILHKDARDDQIINPMIRAIGKQSIKDEASGPFGRVSQSLLRNSPGKDQPHDLYNRIVMYLSDLGLQNHVHDTVGRRTVDGVSSDSERDHLDALWTALEIRTDGPAEG